jgi:hypothetical protein
MALQDLATLVTPLKSSLRAVLPGLEAAPLIEQKTTAIWRKHAAISNFSKIPLLFRYFLSFLCTNFQLQEAVFP